MKRIMRGLGALLTMVDGSSLVYADDVAPPLEEVGVDERLGSVVPLDLVLTDESGRPVTLRSLLDKPTILTLNYFRCAGICTPQLRGVADVLARADAIPGKDFQVLTVSFDDRDTAEIAAQKRMNYLHDVKRTIPAGAWRFLTGSASTTRALADAVGFRFKRQGDDFIHPAVLVMLSPRGQVTRYIYGVRYLPADVQMATLEAANGRARPTITNWLEICFGDAPAARGYVLAMTRVFAAATLGCAALFIGAVILRGRRKEQGRT